MSIREILPQAVAPAAKAVTALLLPFALVVLGWVADNAGVPVDVSPDEVSTWITTAVVAVLNAGVVYYVRNGAEPDPATSTPET